MSGSSSVRAIPTASLASARPSRPSSWYAAYLNASNASRRARSAGFVVAEHRARFVEETGDLVRDTPPRRASVRRRPRPPARTARASRPSRATSTARSAASTPARSSTYTRAPGQVGQQLDAERGLVRSVLLEQVERPLEGSAASSKARRWRSPRDRPAPCTRSPCAGPMSGTASVKWRASSAADRATATFASIALADPGVQLRPLRGAERRWSASGGSSACANVYRPDPVGSRRTRPASAAWSRDSSTSAAGVAPTPGRSAPRRTRGPRPRRASGRRSTGSGSRRSRRATTSRTPSGRPRAPRSTCTGRSSIRAARRSRSGGGAAPRGRTGCRRSPGAAHGPAASGTSWPRPRRTRRHSSRDRPARRCALTGLTTQVGEEVGERVCRGRARRRGNSRR